MRDVRQDIEQNRDTWQGLLAVIPGFQGYSSRELRREADRVVREHLVAGLDQAKDKIERARQALSEKLALGELGKIEGAARDLMTLTDRIRFSDSGYSGYFDAVKITDDTLDQVYELDASMVSELGALSETAEAVLTGAQGSNVSPALAEFSSAIGNLNQKLSRREDVLRGVVD